MNILAHFYLSDQDDELLLGAYLGDFIKGDLSVIENKQVQKGARIHREIDAFSDVHPAFISSMKRFDREFRRFSGIIVDIFYDHFLAKHWQHYSDKNLQQYSTEIQEILERNLQDLPENGKAFLRYMNTHNLPFSYQDFAVLEKVFYGLSNYRLKRKNPIEKALEQLQKNYDGFEADFFTFIADAKVFALSRHN